MDRGAHGCLLDPDRALPARARNGGEPLYSKGGFALSLRTFVVAVLLCGDAPAADISRVGTEPLWSTRSSRQSPAQANRRICPVSVIVPPSYRL